MTSTVCFDHLDFFDANVGNIRVLTDLVEIHVSNVAPSANCPKEAAPSDRFNCVLIFRGVTRSDRIIIKYVDAGLNFEKPITVHDVVSKDPLPGSRIYELEGVLESPHAWIEEWKIVATDCEVVRTSGAGPTIPRS